MTALSNVEQFIGVLRITVYTVFSQVSSACFTAIFCDFSVNVIVISLPNALSVSLHSQFVSRGRASINVPIAELAELDDNLLRGALIIDADALCFLQRNTEYADADHQRLLAMRQTFLSRCRALDVPYILLSDGRVLGVTGDAQGENLEEEKLAPMCAAGRQLAALEYSLVANGGQGMVLRTGPLIAVQDDNFLSDCLATMRGGKVLRLNDSGLAYPTPVTDLARVISGLVDQISCGTPCRGVYHYCSSGAASAYEFAEVACAFASQFVAPLGDLEVDDNGSGWRPEVPNLSCERILQDFGIKRLPWRGYLPRMIKTVCEEKSK